MWCVSSWWKPTRFLGMDEGIILWKALLALMFWRLKNLANSFELSQTRQRKRPWSVHYMCMQVLYTGMFVMFVFWCMHCIYTLAWGFSRCTLKDDISYLLPTWLSVGTRKRKRKHHFVGWQERTNKMKNKSCATNFATQQPFSLLLLLQEPFLLAERKKMCYLSMTANQSQYTNINSFILGYIY